MNYSAILKRTTILFLVILFTLGASTAVHAAGWVAETSGTTANLNGVSFSTPTSGLAVGSGGIIRKTINGGSVWTSAGVAGTIEILNDVFIVPGTSIAYVVGNSGTIRKSIDLGTVWSTQTSGNGAHLYGVHFVSSTNGLAVGDEGNIRKTLNGGSTWTTSNSGTSAVLNDVVIVPGTSIAYVVGNGGVIRKSINLGTSWSAQTSGTTANLNSVYFIDTVNGWAVGNSGTILHTTNGGSTWTSQTSGTGAHLLAVEFIDSQNGWIGGISGTVRKTTDGGSTWNVSSGPASPPFDFFDFAFPGTSTGWAVGSSGTIWLYDSTSPSVPANLIRTTPDSDTTPTFTWSASTDNVGVTGYEFNLVGFGLEEVAVTTYTTSNLAVGDYTVSVRARDAAGNYSSAATLSFSITDPDITPPNTGIFAMPASSTTETTATFSFNAPGEPVDTVITFECRLDGSAFVACASPYTLTGLSQGSHTFQVRGTDSAGNTDLTPASYSWTITAAPPADTTAPDTTITSGPALSTTATSASFSFTATESATFTCALDGSSFVACASPYTLTGLSQGNHTFQVRASDAAGNTDQSPASYSWSISTSTPPSTPPPTNPSTPTSPSVSGPPFALDQMQTDATIVNGGNQSTLLVSLGYASVAMCQMSESEAGLRVDRVFGTGVLNSVRASIINFTACGTVSTLHLGAGERLGVVNSYKSAFERLPTTIEHWFDITKISNGRFPGESSKQAEFSAQTRFRSVYLRNANISQQNDNAAINIMAYGLRPLPRNLTSESAAISIYKKIFGRTPLSATEWDALRAIAYSGAVR
ncbi:MAG: YCF48-related protein [bacterium]|nr:YCF48-related protein [bacterium]